MKLVSDEDLARAREMDLLTYLTYYEPGNLKHVSGNTYSTVEHDSLIINNGKWCWFSQLVKLLNRFHQYNPRKNPQKFFLCLE